VAALAIWLVLLAVPAAAEIDWEAANEHSVIELVTVDPDGDLRVTKVWLAVQDGHGWVRTNDSRWFGNIGRDPEILLRIDGRDHPIRARVELDPAVRERVDAAFREKYGWQVKWMEFFGADGGENLLALTAR
jgi:hypothetical protein